MPEVTFIAACALDYAQKNKIKLPKKAKEDPDLLLEVMQEELERRSKEESGDEQPFECERCRKVVLEADVFCWYCGFDVSDDGSGGWKPPAEEKPEVSKPEEKPAETTTGEQQAPETTEEDPEVTPEEIEAAASEESETTGERKEYAGPTTAENPSRVAEPGGKKTLKEYTETIVRRDGDSGHGAWMIGRDLLEVDADNLFLDGGYDTLEEYAAADLAISWKMATDYMRIAGALTEEQSKLVGIFKLKLIVAAKDEEHRERLLKAGTAKALGGEGYDRDQLKDLKDQLEGKGGGDGGGSSGEKKKRSPFLKLIKEGTFEGRRTEDRLAIDLDDDVVLRVEVLKTKGKAWFEKRED